MCGRRARTERLTAAALFGRAISHPLVSGNAIEGWSGTNTVVNKWNADRECVWPTAKIGSRRTFESVLNASCAKGRRATEVLLKRGLKQTEITGKQSNANQCMQSTALSVEMRFQGDRQAVETGSNSKKRETIIRLEPRRRVPFVAQQDSNHGLVSKPRPGRY